MRFIQPELGYSKVTQYTPFYMVFAGLGYKSEPRGFDSLEDCRAAFAIVRRDGHYRGITVTAVRVVGDTGTIYSGSL